MLNVIFIRGTVRGQGGAPEGSAWSFHTQSPQQPPGSDDAPPGRECGCGAAHTEGTMYCNIFRYHYVSVYLCMAIVHTVISETKFNGSKY